MMIDPLWVICPSCGRLVRTVKATARYRGKYGIPPHKDSTYRVLCLRSGTILSADEARSEK